MHKIHIECINPPSPGSLPDENRAMETQDHYTLCRCGHSKKKPFCDGSHRYEKFEDDKN